MTKLIKLRRLSCSLENLLSQAISLSFSSSSYMYMLYIAQCMPSYDNDFLMFLLEMLEM